MTVSEHTVSRRTVLKGAAWSVPIVVAAVAVPMAAASINPMSELEFYLTAGQVIGSGAAAAVQSNGVRISPADPQNPKVIAAGTTFQITISYNGSNPDFDFLNFPFPYTLDLVKQNMPAWTVASTSAKTIVLIGTTDHDSSEPVVGSFNWPLNPAVRPEDNSISITGIAVIKPGGGYPDGGTLTNLIVDPNAGTGSLTGPTQGTWPA